MLTICIGYDEHEKIAFHVLAHSIMRRASRPVAIIPVMLSQLSQVHKRLRSPEQSTDFTYTRFLTPWIAGGACTYEPANTGPSIFMDCDMLCLTDITELEDIAREHIYDDVLVVKHEYTPKPENKFRNQKQTTYPCKNWSSLMVFNGHRMAVRYLSPAYVDQAPAMDLHQFRWASTVGSLPPIWNHLVGEYPPNPHARIVHFTRGGPWFKGFERCEYSSHWFAEFEDMCHCETYSPSNKKRL